MRIQAGGYFGERALLQSEPRAANVISVGSTSCLYISRQAFEEVLGPLGDLMALHSRVREAESLGIVRATTRRQEEQISDSKIDRFSFKAQVCGRLCLYLLIIYLSALAFKCPWLVKPCVKKRVITRCIAMEWYLWYVFSVSVYVL
jgi:CRP-like cAMP-binding protein